MLCEKCGSREANVHFVEVVNGSKTEHNLCAECARTMGLDRVMGSIAATLSGDESIARVLSGILGIPAENQPRKQEEWDQVLCPNCGMSYSQFVEESRFGCPECYGTFDLLMKENLKKLQAGDTHTGKRPRFGRKANFPEAGVASREETLSPEEKLRLLEAKLKKAVEDEEFEDAAYYRDQIKELKGAKKTSEMV